MSRALTPGLSAERPFVVEGALLTDVGGTLGREVLSTPGMIAAMERTCAMLAFEHLEDGLATVGFEVRVRHVAPAQAGAECLARVRLDRMEENRKLFFAVEVLEGARTIGVGTHQRRVVRQGGGT